jgi:hypothetical protein
MDLTGKYILMSMPAARAVTIFGQLHPGEKLAKTYEGVETFIGGVVEGEAIGVGLWVAIDLFEKASDHTELFDPVAKMTRLIHWSLIENAALFKDKPSQAEMGFRPR